MELLANLLALIGVGLWWTRPAPAFPPILTALCCGDVRMSDHDKARVFAVSDLHVDFRPNMAWVESLSDKEFASDTLVLAGDLSDRLDRLEQALRRLRHCFARVFFVPGNHELWLRDDTWVDSLQKHGAILDLCRDCGIEVEAGWVRTLDDDRGVWIVPLQSWYVKPEEGSGSLFRPKPGEDSTLSMWVDNYLVRWPGNCPGHASPADHFLAQNEPSCERQFDAPVITMSHFLPRRDLIRATPEERRADPQASIDQVPAFNFSRVAGDSRLDLQLRRVGSVLHVYGHQHRNRWRYIDGVTYVSNCVGTPGGSQYPLPAHPDRVLKRIW